MTDLQYKMFLLNITNSPFDFRITAFTIQNVPIKLYLQCAKNLVIMNLQYKMFLLNIYNKIKDSMKLLFTIQNVPIKFLYHHFLIQ